MTTIFKKDVEVTSNSNTNYVTIHFYYYKSESGKKGYYISIQPIYREEKDGLVYTEFRGFSGYKLLVLEVTRKSKKAENQAKDIINNTHSYGRLLQQVLEENDLTLVNTNDTYLTF